jgi:hypothetical protein
MVKYWKKAPVAALMSLSLAVVPAFSQAPPAAPAAPAPSAATSAPASKNFSQEQLDQMLASIALYPDSLLSQVLMASTYPLEVVEAARWAKEHASLKGDALQNALKDQKWDESVKSLAAFPDVLERMNKDLSWTQQLGDAFLGQQQQVMDTVQNLRKKAQAAGNLETNAQQKVVVENNYITVEPANPQVVYVPTYNPTVVYGTWWWPAYPPYYPPYWTYPGAAFVRGFAWGVGIAAGAALWGGFNWNNHDVNINVNKYNNFNKTNISNGKWQHNAAHREGVPYRDNGSRQKYGAQDRAAAQSRDQFRGRDSSLGGQGLDNRQDLNRQAQSGNFNRDAGNRGGGGDFGQNRGAQSNAVGNRASDRGGSFNAGNGAQAREYSNRGQSSMGNRSMSSGGARAGGGGARGGGGGGRGGGRR